MKGKRDMTSSSSDLDPPSKRPARRAAFSTRVVEGRNDTDNTVGTVQEPVGEDQHEYVNDTVDHNDQYEDTVTDRNDNANIIDNVTKDGLIANIVMKILAHLTPADIAAFRHERQQTHAYGRASAFPCFDQISPDIWAVVAGFVSCTDEMWEGESEVRRYLNPLRHTDDLTVLKRLLNKKEQLFLDVLQDNYPGHKDQNLNEMFAQALNIKMPTTYTTKTDITKLNEMFGKLKSWRHKGNFTDDQEQQICLAIKNQLDTSSPIHQRVIHHTFKPVPTRIGELATKTMSFALDEEAHVSALRARGYVITPETVRTQRAPTPGPSGLTADGNPQNKSGNPKGREKIPKTAKTNQSRCPICGNDPSRQPSTELNRFNLERGRCANGSILTLQRIGKLCSAERQMGNVTAS